MNNLNILHEDFDFQTHADNFFDYLEVIIRPNGKIEYAVPSHQIKLEDVYIELFSESEFQRNMMCDEAFRDYLQWLVDSTCCCCVWDDFCVKPKNITKAQLQSLKKLADTSYTHMPLKLYRGEV